MTFSLIYAMHATKTPTPPRTKKEDKQMIKEISASARASLESVQKMHEATAKAIRILQELRDAMGEVNACYQEVVKYISFLAIDSINA